MMQRNGVDLKVSPRDDETLDPREARRIGRRSDWLVSFRILFHPDLSRVGERAVFGPAGAAASSEPIQVGRSLPFRDAHGHERPLGDPCISRRQLTVRWSSVVTRFALEVPDDARRDVEVLDASGKSLGTAPFDARPGSLVRIGDRVLLGLELLPSVTVPGSPALLGDSVAMRELHKQIDAVAGIDRSVIVQGPIGAGKELVARAIHSRSPRRDEPFVAVNCAALPANIVESELFGHVKGAFSGAVTHHDGLFAAADGGSLFLDEVGELSADVQAKLLRALEQRAVRPIGQSAERPVDVRVIAATHRALAEEAASGRFREDLLSRLGALFVTVPALSERKSDIPVLFTHFLRQVATRPELATRLFRPADEDPPPLPLGLYVSLLQRDYPHNVRGLSALAARVVAAFVADDGDPEALLAAVQESEEVDSGRTNEATGRPSATRLLQLLEEHDHVHGRVAKALGVSHSTVDRWMQEHRLVRARDLAADAIRAALASAGGDLTRAAKALGVSARGLTLRIRDLGIEE
jgi:DNA-binding NtrC family response regulator